jgi:hypothetical protein
MYGAGGNWSQSVEVGFHIANVDGSSAVEKERGQRQIYNGAFALIWRFISDAGKVYILRV